MNAAKLGLVVLLLTMSLLFRGPAWMVAVFGLLGLLAASSAVRPPRIEVADGAVRLVSARRPRPVEFLVTEIVEIEDVQLSYIAALNSALPAKWEQPHAIRFRLSDGRTFDYIDGVAGMGEADVAQEVRAAVSRSE